MLILAKIAHPSSSASLIMPDLIVVIVFFVGACLTMAIGVWLLVRKKMRTDRTSPASSVGGSVEASERRSMQVGDWFNAAISVLIGVLLGSAVHGLVQLFTTGFWLTAAMTITLSAVLFLFMELSDKLLDRLFTIGVKPARKQHAQEKKPLPSVLSLPVGFVIGIFMAYLGMDDALLGMLP